MFPKRHLALAITSGGRRGGKRRDEVTPEMSRGICQEYGLRDDFVNKNTKTVCLTPVPMRHVAVTRAPRKRPSSHVLNLQH